MRHLILHFLIFIVFFVPRSLAQLDELSFWHLTTANGLSDDNITCLLQDRLGFIWIGTTNGLNRYDGNTIQKYYGNPFDSLNISGNRIQGLYEDISGKIWIRQSHDIHCFDPKTETFFTSYENWDEEILGANPRKDLESLFGFPVEQLLTTNGNNPIFATLQAYPNRIIERKDKTIWTYSSEGIQIFDLKTGKPIKIPPTGDLLNEKLKNIISIGKDSFNGVWVSSTDSLYRLDAGTKSITNSFRGNPRITAIDSKRRAWMSYSGEGLLVYDMISNKTHRYEADPFLSNGLSSNTINSILEDNQGRIWIGTDQGINIYDPYKINFKHYYHNPYNPNGLSGNPIRSVIENEEKGIWIGTSGDEINYLDFETQKFKQYYPLKEGKKGQFGNWGYFYKDTNGKIYVTSLGVQKATLVYDEKIDNFIPYHPDDLTIKLPYFTQTFPFLDSRGGRYYYSFPGGMISRNEFYNVGLFYQPSGIDTVFHFQSQSNIFQSQSYELDSLSGNYIYDIEESSIDGSIWIATHLGGLNKFNPKTKKFTQYQHEPSDPTSLIDSYPTDLLEDQYNNIWIAFGYGQGLSMIPHEAIKFDSIYFVNYNVYTSDLPTNDIHQIHEDASGYIWLGSEAGPIRYDFQTNTFKVYQFSSKNVSSIIWGFSKGESGRFYLGNNNGLFSFHPDSIKSNPYPPEIYITDLSINNKTVPIKGGIGDTLNWSSPLQQSILFTKELTLPYWQNDFSFAFVGINYTYPEQNQYQYILENYNDDWITTSQKEASATYTNISPGKYTFRVRAANNNGVWNTEGTSIFITIRPPWWQTTWAYAMYVFLIGLFGYLLYRYLLNRQLELQEAKRIKELDNVKTKLYTNISHEFRTPLTVISGMGQKILENPKKWGIEGGQLITRNSNYLLQLVNQILDLRKLESGSLKVQPIQSDIVSFLQYLLQSFHSLAENKDIRLHFYAEEKELVMDFDPGKIQHIFTNLLSNAIKYTPEGGDVYISVQSSMFHVPGMAKREHNDSYLLLKIRDTGIGIPEDQLPHIFDRFYQVDDTSTRKGEGTGIGLALTKELVQLLKGEISVKSDPDAQSGSRGTEFSIQLPISNEAPLQETVQDQMSEVFAGMAVAGVDADVLEKNSVGTDSKPLALVVEDNADVAKYLFSCLEDRYQLLWAKNGQQGIDKAFESVPDIIISDVMMPEKDGFEVCQTLKQDVRTSHIPIILLTAKADIDSKLEGLSHGADAYLAKPFNPKELDIRLEQLIELRKKLQSRYQDHVPLKQKSGNLEDEFLTQLNQIILNNISDENFGIQQLCRAIGMSRTQLHRKIKALTGKSTSIYIRSVKLSKARELLKTTKLNISEIAYEVGFSNPVYFTQVFSEEFGVPPSEMRE